MVVKFARIRGPCEKSSLNRLILLHGPPGTGKTSLALGLAQKASIRLSQTFTATKLIQIDTSTLFSKWLGESAQKVKEIFSSIVEMCEKSPDHFICVVLDEIESLASSRAESAARMEVHDTIRATNALLQAFDILLEQTNILVIATSNMREMLDQAFISRCDYAFSIDLPSVKARYAILRRSLQTLIHHGIIQTQESIPSYKDAWHTTRSQPDRPGSILLQIAELLSDQDGRKLSKLAEAAIVENLLTDTCELHEALEFIKAFMLAEGIGCESNDKVSVPVNKMRMDAATLGARIHIRGNKRKSDAVEPGDPGIEPDGES